MPNDELQVGSRVITSFGNVGIIEKMDKNVAEVLVGGMRLREKIVNLQLAQAAELGAKKAEKRAVGNVSDGRDESYMARTPRVRIIHGFGTGALKNYVHHFLKNSDLVERFEFAPSSQGGNGATVAELKQ